MSLLLHGLIALTYVGISLVLAFALPQIVPALGSDVAMFGAGGFLVVAALMHQGATQTARARRFTEDLRVLRASNAAVQTELRRARQELRIIGDQPLMAADPLGPGDGEAPASSAEESAEADAHSRREIDLLKAVLAQLPKDMPIATEAAAPSPPAERPMRLNGNQDERLAPTGAGAAPTARAATARRDMNGETEYRRHLVADRLLGSDFDDPPPGTAGAAGEPAPDAAILEMTRDALERARVTLFAQPIVSLPNRRTRYYEAFSRIRSPEGDIVGPEQYLRVATDAGLIAAIDNNLLFRCVQLMRRLHRSERNIGFFCNVSPHTVHDDSFFPQFLDFLGDNKELANDLVFEFSQADMEAGYHAMADGLDALQRLGYRFSLDQVARLDLNFGALAKRRFEFVKLDVRTILDLCAEPEGARRIERLLEDARRAGVSIVVEKIETERQLVELLDFPFPYGQGYLFGEPRESRLRA
ncbi:MAG: EAL domain-containing protein [Alphaproteobacteria bacterium]